MSSFHFDKVKIQHSNGQPASKPKPCCTECGQKATLFVTQVNATGKLLEKAYCIFHAIKEGLLHPKAWDLIKQAPALHKPAELTCKCGMSQSLFKSKGRAGCSHCYTTFASIVKPALPKIHNGTAHAGKAPKKFAKRIDVRRRVEALKMAMDRAIKKEAYEEAAVCRDQIAELMSK